MSLSKSPESISSESIQRLTTSLTEFKYTIVGDIAIMEHLNSLKKIITDLQDIQFAGRSEETAGTLSRMSEEQRRLLLMWPEERKFFLHYKNQHPDNPWGYYEQYQKNVSEAYRQSGELPPL